MIAFTYYLLKVFICSGILFLYYHVALRNKLFHQWNRFYLLLAVVISLVVPLIQINIFRQSSSATSQAIQLLQVVQSADGYLEEITISNKQSYSADQWLMMLYILVSGVFLTTLLLSLQKIYSIIRSHSVQWIEKIKFINTSAKGTPFSFFHFIFWNNKIDVHSETGQQILQHELVHVREQHTLDKVFIQLILVVFWCNPFFWLLRRELRLIHEFIADKKAIGEHGTAALAAMILNASYASHFNSITNQFFQTPIKRRLAMLTKIQNPKINYLSRVLALPLITLTVLAFTLRSKNIPTPISKPDKSFTVVVDAGHGKSPDGAMTGARSGNIYEDEITFALAKKIKELNINENINIVFTRSTEDIVDLQNRVDIAKKHNADLFISLHVNALPNEKADSSGMEVWVSGKKVLYQKESELLGSLLQQELNTVYPTKPYLKRRATAVWVLDKNVCPAVLVEFGYLTNNKDKEFITKAKNQAAIAERILGAIHRYATSQNTIGWQAEVRPLELVSQKDTNGRVVFQSDEISFKSQGLTEATLKALVIINNKRYDAKALQGKQIVSKKITVYNENDKDAIEKFGPEAKYGVMVFENAVIKEVVKPIQNKKTDTVPNKNNTGNERKSSLTAKNWDPTRLGSIQSRWNRQRSQNYRWLWTGS